jgi:hypothetical protein
MSPYMAAETRVHPSGMVAIRFQDGQVWTASTGEIRNYYGEPESWIAAVLMQRWAGCSTEVPDERA